MEAAIGTEVKPRSQYLFYSAIVLSIFVIIGFSLKVIVHPFRLARYTPLVIAHAGFMMAWLFLFAYQARLVTLGNLKRHKQLGSISILLVIAMITTGEWASINLFFEHQRTDLLVGNAFTMFTFLCLYGSAIYAVSKGNVDTHKRMIIIASLSIIGPAIGRYLEVLDVNVMLYFAVYPIILIALPVGYDLSINNKIHKATYAGISFVVAMNVLMMASMPVLIPYFNQFLAN
ncbi:hypothetical protein [Thalassotalea sp. PS06]|uniref:hypothetical protein n=1 Tax=Thalassotalea sp. PS06 TaxID=2594005 RepID=UPI0011652C5B|nr:hypothetical protein [Thalassotalea sp. PS06]QDP00912.1 hypothetical protein FNC98_05845 [Thalassotalea sp. PS06]